MKKYVLWWFPMVLLAVLNGTARDLGYQKYVSALAAHQISTISLMLLIGIYSYFVMKRWPPKSEKMALFVGLYWSLFTLLFEFGFGLLRGASWAQLLAAYDFTTGQIWILIPIWVALAPYLAFKTLEK